MPNLTIERATHADIPALADLLALLFSIEKDFSADANRQRRGLELLLQQPQQQAAVFVARRPDRTAAGMISAQLVISSAEGAPSAWIEDVVIDADYRGRGIARMLLDAALDWAQRAGATRAQLLADQSNLPALGLYEHLGWQSTRLGAWRIALPVAS